MFMTIGGVFRVENLPEDILDSLDTQRQTPFHGETSSPPLHTFAGSPSGITLERSERNMIETAVQEMDGNIKLAAARLGISVSTIYRKLSQYKSGK